MSLVSKSHKTGDERHRLSNVMVEMKLANCSICGPTTLYIKGGRPRCATKSMCEQMQLGYYIGMKDIEKLIGRRPIVCSVCLGARSHRLVVDHDHDTDEIRGWLCDKCNLALGYLGDDADTIYRLAEYMNKYNKKKEEKS